MVKGGRKCSSANALSGNWTLEYSCSRYRQRCIHRFLALHRYHQGQVRQTGTHLVRCRLNEKYQERSRHMAYGPLRHLVRSHQVVIYRLSILLRLLSISRPTASDILFDRNPQLRDKSSIPATFLVLASFLHSEPPHSRRKPLLSEVPFLPLRPPTSSHPILQFPPQQCRRWATSPSNQAILNFFMNG